MNSLVSRPDFEFEILVDFNQLNYSVPSIELFSFCRIKAFNALTLYRWKAWGDKRCAQEGGGWQIRQKGFERKSK